MSFISGKVEQVVLAPGFGVIVTGWALANVYAPAKFLLKVAGQVFSTAIEPVLAIERPDLREALNVSVDIFRRPGFIAVFPFEKAVQSAPESFAIQYQDGSIVELSIDVGTVRLLGKSISADDLLDLCPQLTESKHWDALRQAIIVRLAKVGAEAEAVQLARAERALFLCCPDDHSGQRLLLETIDCASWRGTGLVLYIRHEAYSAPFAHHLRRLAVENIIPLSLILIPEPDQAIYTIPKIAETIGSSVLAFIGADITASAADMSDTIALVRDDLGSEPILLRVHDRLTGRTTTDLSAFVMRRNTLAEIVANLTPVLSPRPYRLPRDLAVTAQIPALSRTRTRALSRNGIWFDVA